MALAYPGVTLSSSLAPDCELELLRLQKKHRAYCLDPTPREACTTLCRHGFQGGSHPVVLQQMSWEPLSSFLLALIFSVLKRSLGSESLFLFPSS